MHYELNQSESNELQKQKSIVEGKKKKKCVLGFPELFFVWISNNSKGFMVNKLMYILRCNYLIFKK